MPTIVQEALDIYHETIEAMGIVVYEPVTQTFDGSQLGDEYADGR